MQTADFDYNDFDARQANQADKALLVKFFIKPRLDKAKSDDEGRPIYRDVEYVDIKIPGNRTAGACRPATDADKQRFPDHYAAFKQRVDDDVTEGTPLAEWPAISRSQVEELSFFHIKTVEQLGNMADVQVGKFMGLYDLREKARAWLLYIEGKQDAWKIEEKVREMQEENDKLREQLNEAIATLENTSKNPRQRARQAKRVAKAVEVDSDVDQDASVSE